MQEMDECEAAKKTIQIIKPLLSLKPAKAKREIEKVIKEYDEMLKRTTGNTL